MTPQACSFNFYQSSINQSINQSIKKLSCGKCGSRFRDLACFVTTIQTQSPQTKALKTCTFTLHYKQFEQFLVLNSPAIEVKFCSLIPECSHKQFVLFLRSCGLDLCAEKYEYVINLTFRK